MAKVKVSLTSYFNKKIGLKEVELVLVDNSTIMDLVKEMEKRFGKEFSNLVINKKTARLNALIAVNRNKCKEDYILKDGDVVSIFPALAGG